MKPREEGLWTFGVTLSFDIWFLSEELLVNELVFIEILDFYVNGVLQ